jgi:serine/threonine-protein kinase
MNERHDPNRTVDVPSAPADSLDAGLAAGFGPPRSSLADMRPVLLNEAEGDSAQIVKPKSDAMPPPEQTGDRYQLQGEIARGGMGAVLRGRDVDLGRDLAVKVLLEKYVDRPEVARRFIEEAQIGGQLQHPGVVPVYDIGRFGDRPFFTMKLVKGQTLAALLSERQAPVAHAPGSPKDVPRFLAIALQVAQTMAYAHAKGVIHRDLKPANIMVGAFGEVQVMDWGLAKVLPEGGVADEEKASRERERPENVTTIRTARSSGSAGSFGTDTEAGSLLGTPAYMPPEQANGDIANLDRRADVFGLGAIVCEILTGRAPYVGRSAEEVRRKACNGDLADALGRLDACGADQELIGLTKTCLSAEAIDRPKDAQAVAAGLSAYQGGVQEKLRRAELAEAEAKAKAIEEAKRRRLTLALAGTVLLALTLGGGGWLYVKSERDARQAQVNRDVNDALNQATALREQAKTVNVGSAALFAQARERAQRARALVDSAPADISLKARVEQLQSELDAEQKDRQLLAALEAIRLTQAEIVGQKRLGPERLLTMIREALREYTLLPGEGKPAEVTERLRQRPRAVREALAFTLSLWINLVENHQLKAPASHMSWLAAMKEGVEPTDGLRRQIQDALRVKGVARPRQALELLAETVDVSKQSAVTLVQLGDELWKLGSWTSAVRLLRQVREQYPADFWVNHQLAFALYNIRPTDRNEVVRFLTAAAALRPMSALAQNHLANALVSSGRLDEAIACYQKAIELAPASSMPQANLGLAFLKKGQADAAIRCFRRAVELDPKDSFAHRHLGIALAAGGRRDDAIASYHKAIELDPKDMESHFQLGILHVQIKNHGRAMGYFRKCIELKPAYALAHLNLGISLRATGQLDEAIASCKQAIALDPKDVKAHNNMGNALSDKGQLDDAIASFRKAIEIDPQYAPAYSNLGFPLRRQGRFNQAIASYKKALELDPKFVSAYTELGMMLGTDGQVDEAIACFRKVVALQPMDASAHWRLGLSLADTGQVDEAIVCYEKALELDPNDGVAPKLLSLAKRLAAARDRFPAFKSGSYRPATAKERLELAAWCRINQLYRTAAGLCTEAFAADRKLASDFRSRHRYDAACWAAQAAAGQGKDASKLNDTERARLRKQALSWLRADLALWTKELQNGAPAARAMVPDVLLHWHHDRDLARIRNAAALAKLPGEERVAFTQLWADVAALLKQAQTPAKVERKR